MSKEELKSVIEAILFAWSDPLSVKDLSNVLDVETKEIRNTLKEMIDEFNYEHRGIQIIQMNNHYQMSTKPEYHKYLKKIFIPKNNRSLTQAALETLVIIAYKQQITKTEVEQIRGVKCDRAIKTLLEKDLIEEKGRLEKTGRPILYGTTLNFLKVFDLKSLEELPTIESFDFSSKENTTKNIYDK